MSTAFRFDAKEFKRIQSVSTDLEILESIKCLYTKKIVLASLMSYEYDEYLELLEKVLQAYTTVLDNKKDVYLYVSEDEITSLYNYIHRIASDTVI